MLIKILNWLLMNHRLELNPFGRRPGVLFYCLAELLIDFILLESINSIHCTINKQIKKFLLEHYWVSFNLIHEHNDSDYVDDNVAHLVFH